MDTLELIGYFAIGTIAIVAAVAAGVNAHYEDEKMKQDWEAISRWYDNE